MLIWFLVALGSAILNSLSQAAQKLVVLVGRYSKFTLSFVMTATAATILILLSYIIHGMPTVGPEFWKAVFISGLLNAVAFPVMLKAYEVGEFSSVYSMILLTPVFLLITSFFTLGEAPTLTGVIGVILTVVGLVIVARGKEEAVKVPDARLGNWLGVGAAFIFSISVNYDKLAAVHSDRFLGFGAISAVAAVIMGAYLLVRHRRLIVQTTGVGAETVPHHLAFSNILILFVLGCLMALNGIFHSSALLLGFASYTIAVKRLGVLFGVVWGWLFFHEKNISRKFFGAAVAVAGVIAILFS